MTSVVLGVDVGGTRIKSVVMAADGRTLDELVNPTPSSLGRTLGPVVAGLVRAHLARCLDQGAQVQCRAVGVVVPGVVDDDRGVGLYSANLGWRDLAIREQVSEQLDVPVAVSHDVRSGLVAESRLGAAVGVSNALFVPIGTGIASSALVDGRHLVDPHSGEIGHVIVRPEGEPCGCGSRGCLETIASARAIGHRFEQLTGAAESAGGAAEVARLVAAHSDGETAGSATTVALQVWNDAVDALASVLAPVAAALGTERIAVGGGLVRSGETLLHPLRQAVASRLGLPRRVDVVPAALGDRAGALGAACLAWDAVRA